MDSIEYADPESVNGINLYSYCINDPVNYIDPFGTFVISGSLMFLGGLALLVLGVAGLTAVSQPSTANPDFSLDIGIDALPGSVVEAQEEDIKNNPVQQYQSTPAKSKSLITITDLGDDSIVFSSEHTKNKRPSTKNKHQKGQRSKKKNAPGGESGDARRYFRRNGKHTNLHQSVFHNNHNTHLIYLLLLFFFL